MSILTAAIVVLAVVGSGLVLFFTACVWEAYRRW